MHKTPFFVARRYLPLCALAKVYKKEKRTKPFLSPPKTFTTPTNPNFFLFLYCVHPAILHLSVLGWMNSSIQKHYYAERRAGGRIAKRGGGWRWGKSRGCWTPCKRLPSEPFNSLSSKVKSLTSKPMGNWKCLHTVCACVCARSSVCWGLCVYEC